MGARIDLQAPSRGAKQKQGIENSTPSPVVTLAQAAKVMDVDRSYVSNARFILDKGSPEQIQDFENEEAQTQIAWLCASRDADPVFGEQILSIPDQPTRRVLALLTEDGSLALGVTAESAQAIADTLSAAAEEMRKAG